MDRMLALTTGQTVNYTHAGRLLSGDTGAATEYAAGFEYARRLAGWPAESLAGMPAPVTASAVLQWVNGEPDRARIMARAFSEALDALTLHTTDGTACYRMIGGQIYIWPMKPADL